MAIINRGKPFVIPSKNRGMAWDTLSPLLFDRGTIGLAKVSGRRLSLSPRIDNEGSYVDDG